MTMRKVVMATTPLALQRPAPTPTTSLVVQHDSITFLSASVFEVTVGGGAGNDLHPRGGADASTVTDVQIRANE